MTNVTFDLRPYTIRYIRKSLGQSRPTRNKKKEIKRNGITQIIMNEKGKKLGNSYI